MGKIIDRDKNKRRLFPIKTTQPEASVHKLDIYAKRIQKAEKLNIILISINVIIILGILCYVNF